MANGKHSPIVEAIAAAEKKTTGEIRVHLSRQWVERDPFAHAQRLFHRFGMEKTRHRNAVLFYLNLKRRKFAIVGDQGIHQAVGQVFWNELSRKLAQGLRETHSERAIADAVLRIGEMLEKFFPADMNSPRVNGLPDEISED